MKPSWRSGRGQTEHRDPVGAKIILAAARGQTNAAIAASLRIHVDTVPKWRGRYAVHWLDGLKDRARPGSPRTFTLVQVAGIKALACTPQEQRDVPLSRWSGAELAVRAGTEGLVESITGIEPFTVLVRRS
jgi:transposase